jgi:hypothetical protein
LLGAHTVTVEAHGSRLDKVETEVSTIRTEVVGLQVQMRGFGEILQRIESGISVAQQQAIEDKHASRLNPVALAAILITIITTLVGGAWLVGGELARHDERSQFQQHTIDQIEQRQWDQRGGGNARAEPNP